MGYYNKYPGYIIRQRQENTGSLNPTFLNVTGTIQNSNNVNSDLGVFSQIEIPFLFHQPNMPSYKSGQPYRVASSGIGDGDDDTYNWDDFDPRERSVLYFTDEFIYPEITDYISFFTVPSGGSFYITDIYFTTTALTPLSSPTVLHFSIGDDATSYNDICDEQIFDEPSYGPDYIGTTFRVPFESLNPQPSPNRRGPFAPGTQIFIKNGGSSPPIGIRCKFIIKGYFV